MEEYRYWIVNYVSCEGNTRWFNARSPEDWDEDMVERAIPCGGMGDDPSKITSVEETGPNDDYSWELSDDF